MPKPEKIFKAGGVRVAIFRNTLAQKSGQSVKLPKVSLEVRYRDNLGNWRSTNSLSLGDLPKAILALQQAYAYLLEHREEPEHETNDS